MHPGQPLSRGTAADSAGFPMPLPTVLTFGVLKPELVRADGDGMNGPELPPPPEGTLRDFYDRLGSVADRGWRKFRTWPTWLQVVVWLVGYWLLIPVLAWRSSLPPVGKWATTGIVAIVAVVGIVTSAQSPTGTDAGAASSPQSSAATLPPSHSSTVGTPGSGSVAVSGQATERALCAALDGDPNNLSPLIDAVANDAQAGISLQLEGSELEMYLSETNNAPKVQGVIDQMKSTCASQAG